MEVTNSEEHSSLLREKVKSYTRKNGKETEMFLANFAFLLTF